MSLPKIDIKELESISPLAWIVSNKMVTENQKLFEFTSHRFLIEPMNDMSPDQVCQKSAQIGYSCLAILKCLWMAKFKEMNIAYVLPSNNIVLDFVKPKADPLINSNPAVRELVTRDSITLKQVGDRFLYFRSSTVERQAISISVDLLIIDELDRVISPQVLNTYDSRLQASEYGWRWRFSNPSIPAFGINELFNESTQRHWFVKCSHCGHRWHMEFEQDDYSKPHYLDQDRLIFACGSCHKEITVADRINGEWVTKYPTRKRQGYLINQMMAPWVTASRIMDQYKESSIEFFHNFVLGLPYQASEYMINREAILNTTNPGLADKREVMMGCDSGKVKHYVLGNSEGVFNYGKTENWDDIERLIQMYNATCVIDALPDFTVPEKLSRKYPGKVFVNYYVHDSKSIDVINRKEGTEFGVINSDRTKLLDLVAAEIASRSLRFFQEPKSLDELIWHCEQAYRVVEPDTRGILRARWETKVNRPDHFLHALAYYRIARSMAIGSGTGGVTPSAPMKGKPGFYVKDDKVKVKDALGMPFDDLIEKSLRKNRKHKIK